MKEVTQESFNENVSSGLVVVDFFSESCGPCKIMLKVLEELEKEFEGVKFIKANTDKNKDAVAEYGIRAVPSFLFMKDGIVLNLKSGACQKSMLQQLLSNIKGA